MAERATSIALHAEPHPLADELVQVKLAGRHHQFGDMQERETRIEDWWDRVAGFSWMHADGNPACLIYAARSGFSHLPIDNEVVYVKYGGIGVLLHASEVVGVAPSGVGGTDG